MSRYLIMHPRPDEETMSGETTVPKLLTVRQLSDALGVARWRIHEMVARGTAPPHLRVGRTLRFAEDQVVAWIRESEQKGER